MPGQHAGDPGTAAAPTDLAASRSAVLTLELRYFTRHRDFTAIRSPRGTAGLRSSYSLTRSKLSPAQPAAPMRAARVPPPLHNAGQRSSPRRHRGPRSRRRPPQPAPLLTEKRSRSVAAMAGAERGAGLCPPRVAAAEWIQYGHFLETPLRRHRSRGGEGRERPSRRHGPLPGAAAALRAGGAPRCRLRCAAGGPGGALRSAPLRWGHRAGRSPELRELRRYRSDAPRAAGSPRCNDSGRPPWRRRVACGLGWVRSSVPRARCRRAARCLQRAEVGERSLPARSTRPAPSQRLTSAALQQLLARSGGLLALWCPLLQCSYREELLRASGSLSHRRSPHRTCIPVVQHASAFPTLHRFRPDVIVFSSSFPIGAMRASKWNVRLSKECKSTAEEHIEAPRQVRSAYNLLHMRVSEKLLSEQKGSSSGEHSRNPFSTFGHTLRPLF